MSTVSFKRAVETPIQEQQTLPAKFTAQETAVAVPVATFSNPALEGEFTARDMSIPYLSLGQKSGTLCDDHPDWIGKWVYDKNTCLGPEIKVVILKLAKYYEEVTEFGGEDIPQRWDTVAEAKAAGVEYKECATVDLLFDAPAELADAGMIGSLAPARMTVRSSSYGRVVGMVLKDLAGWLKNDLAGGYYRMSVEKKSNGSNSWFVPKLKADGKVAADVRQQIKDTFQV
jgi:hypothetical protein